MAFDLKTTWLAADVSALLASVKDDRSWRLEVTRDGIVHLNDLTEIPDAADQDSLHYPALKGARTFSRSEGG